MPRVRKSAQLVELPLNAMKYGEESRPLKLRKAMGYFSSYLPKAFRVSEGVYSRKGREELAKGEEYFASALSV